MQLLLAAICSIVSFVDVVQGYPMMVEIPEDSERVRYLQDRIVFFCF